METSDASIPTLELQAHCDGTRCSFREPTTGWSRTLRLQDLQTRSGDSRAVLAKHGITVMESRAEDAESYGAWMDHAVFAVQSARAADRGTTFTARFGAAAGDLTGVQPDMTATWHGFMVGTPLDGALRENALHGDAALHYTLTGADNSLDAAFTDIRNLDSGAAHSTSAVRFDDVPVAADGTYRAGLTGNRIQGGFYGPYHAEAAGIFEQGGIVGAFGAKRREGAESPLDQRARAPEIIARIDSLIYSTIFMETSDASVPTLELRANCDGTRCSFRGPTTGWPRTIRAQDLRLQTRSGDSRAVLAKHGITTVMESWAEGAESYGAWMDHARFAVRSARDADQGTAFTARWGTAAGDLTGVQPDMTATWHGFMVGTPLDGALRENALHGDATLRYTLTGADNSLDAAFTDIRNLDSGAAHSTSAVRFDDVPVAADGTYQAGLTGNRIQGGFYGPDHAEAAGIFEQGGIVGAFGAKRR